jgi:hypothetical protein
MDEIYRMLGREHQADLEREAQRRHSAAEIRKQRHAWSTTRRTTGLLLQAASLIRRALPSQLIPARAGDDTRH